MERKIDHLRTQLKDGRISRREFMNRLMVLGVATTTAGSLATWAEQAQAAPTRGGRMRVGIAHGSTTDTLDPATYENGYMSKINYAIQNHLGEVNHTGGMVPELAESWNPRILLRLGSSTCAGVWSSTTASHWTPMM